MATTITELDVPLPDGGVLHAYDTGGDGFPVLWCHGTPNIGAPPRPLFDTSERLGLRWLGYDRPGYGGSTPRPDRSVGSAAGDVRAVVDALGVDRFAVAGHSGGATHALAPAALLPGRVVAVVGISGLAPFDAEGLDWFDGFAPPGVAALGAAAAGRAEKERHEASGDGGDVEFTAADLAMFDGPWGWFGSVVGPAQASGPAPAIDDDLAYVRPWGFTPADVRVPVLVVHGGADRVVPGAHGRWLAAHLPHAELWLQPDDGHISVLRTAPDALAWLRDRIDEAAPSS